MAYMNQERKKHLAALLKTALKGENLKYSVAVRNHSTIVMTIREGDIDFFADRVTERFSPADLLEPVRTYMDINPYWYREQFRGKSLGILQKIFTALNDGNHNRSDLLTDYHDVGWYVDVRVGKWDSPYIYTGK